MKQKKMSLSIRYAIFWPESETVENEPTSTVVLTSPSGLYVDIRKLKNTDDKFDWFFAGKEIEINEKQIEFNHDFYDSCYVDYYFQNGFSSGGFSSSSDIGEFSDSTDLDEIVKGIRIERGSMVNPKTKKLESYVEKWITCNPSISQLEFIGNAKLTRINCIVLDTVDGGISDNEGNTDTIIGRYLMLGKWVQGLLWNKAITESKENSIGILRAVSDATEPIIKYGGQSAKFPGFDDLIGLKLNDIIKIRNVSWKVVEIVNNDFEFQY